MDEVHIINQIGKLIERVGFPVIIALYLLYRFETRIKKMESLIRSLTKKSTDD